MLDHFNAYDKGKALRRTDDDSARTNALSTGGKRRRSLGQDAFGSNPCREDPATQPGRGDPEPRARPSSLDCFPLGLDLVVAMTAVVRPNRIMV